MPGIDYTIGMKTGGFSSGVQGALSQLSSLSARIATLTAGAGLAAGAGVTALIAKSIGKAADLETAQTAFIPLLGSIQAAKDRVAELAKFANETPFEMPEVVEASKNLEVMTQGALSTGRALTMVGDAASFAGKSYGDMATWVGQLYAGLQQGGNAGEPLEQLTRIGVITPQIKAQLAAMKESGKPFADMWAIAEARLMTFGGAMKLQAGTWNGMMSTLKDSISAVMAELGKPVMDSLKPYLQGATDKMDGLKTKAAEVGKALAEVVDLIRAAFETGQLWDLAGTSLKTAFLEAVNALAKGIQATVAALRDSFGAIADDLELLFEGIGDKLGGKIMESIWGSGRISKGYQEMGSQKIQTAKNNMLEHMDQGAWNFGTAFKNAYAGSSDIPGLAEARGQRDELLHDLRQKTFEDRVARIAAQEEAAAKVLGGRKATPEQTPTLSRFYKLGLDSIAAGLRNRVADAAPAGRPAAADRLAQIGGYVGGSAAAMAQKAADVTAKATQRSAELLEKIYSGGGVSLARVF